MSRRRLLILQTQNEKGYFNGYKSDWGALEGLRLQWFSFERSNQFQLTKTLRTRIFDKEKLSMANFNKAWHDTDSSPQFTPLGYDSTKGYNFRIKALNKTINEGYTIEDFNGNGSFTFFFKGPTVTKNSQPINIRDIDQGTEFIISIEKGEILNNFYVEYIPDTLDGSNYDEYFCSILFEVYFEEITE